MSSFYRQRSMGFAPVIAAAMPFLENAMRSRPLQSGLVEERPSQALPIIGALAGITLLGGLAYVALRPIRSRRGS